MQFTSFFLIIVCLSINLIAGERQRMPELEAIVAQRLNTFQRVEFFEMFYFSSGPEHEEDVHAEIREMFDRHFKSGVGRVEVWALKPEKYHQEVLGELKSGVVVRAPGPPFAYLEVYPADKNDPEYMGLNFRLAKINDETRIVFPQHEPGVPLYLEEKESTWKKADQSQFEARLVRVIDGQAHFRTFSMKPVVVPVRELSRSDRERIKALEAEAESVQKESLQR